MSQNVLGETSLSWMNRLHRLVLSGLALLVFVLCAAVPVLQIGGYVIGAAVIATLIAGYHRRGSDRFVGAQAVILAAFVVNDGLRTGHRDVLLIIAGVVIAGLLFNEALFVDSQAVESANVPDRALAAGPLMPPRTQAAIQSGLVLVAGLTAAFTLPSWPLFALTLVIAAIAVVGVVRETLRRKGRNRLPKVLRAALIEHAPEFAVYYSAPPNTEYQLTMWLPYLERIGRPYMIILRERDSLAMISALTSAPIVVCNAVPDVDNVTVPSLTTVFYVNNGMKNAHMVRFSELTHVQLLHGDSDKASSHNPITVMFDKVYVAGQAAIDRYAAHGVHIEPEKFEIVGRPQVESINVVDHAAPRPPTVVMYGTTWAGIYSDANYCSLPIAIDIVTALLARGMTVIFRPHPYVNRNRDIRTIADKVNALLAADRSTSGRAHVFGPEALRLSLDECFNRSDALISDVSGIASDYLYSEKPLAMIDMLGEGDAFVQSFPVAHAAYVLRRDAGNLASVLDDLLDADPLAAVRRDVKVRYLGDFPADSYAEGFVRTARRELSSSPERISQPV